MQLIHGDCLEKMKDIPDKSIDMILCDLPYGTTACKWDVVIPFEPLWEQYKRIIKDKGAIVLFGSEPFSSHLRISNIKQYKYDWIWKKNRPTDKFNAKNRPMGIHENISVFSSGVTANVKTNNKMPYFPQGLISCNIEIRGTTGKWESTKRKSHKEKYMLKATGYPTSLLEYKKDEDHCHHTQKPVALLEYLIKTYTLEGETVLDNTMGSGSTGVACINTKRNFIGIEKDDKYFEIAKKRIEEVIHGLSQN
jgi:site-specific DNA-methyltransferase (adenine-specific)